jgi:serine/threonine protein kinase
MNSTFAGQKKTAKQQRMGLLKKLADESIFANKNEIGLIIDLICSCVNPDPTKRPTINGLLNSPLFLMDKYENLNAQRFSQNVILYRSP